jgi:hypothetical protein
MNKKENLDSKIKKIEEKLMDSPLGLESEKWMGLYELINSKWGYNPWSSQEMDEILVYGYTHPQERDVEVNGQKVHQYLFSYNGFLSFFVKYEDFQRWEGLYKELQKLKNLASP